MAAVKDGLAEETLRDLASLAAWGKHAQNVERDLHRWIPFAFNSKLTTYSTVINIYDPDQGKILPREIPILLASDVLHSLHKRDNLKLWNTCIGASPEKCESYWNAATWANRHPVKVSTVFSSVHDLALLYFAGICYISTTQFVVDSRMAMIKVFKFEISVCRILVTFLLLFGGVFIHNALAPSSMVCLCPGLALNVQRFQNLGQNIDSFGC